MHDEDNDGGFPGKSPVEVPLLDVPGGAVDRALVISNDSDLRFRIERARQHVLSASSTPRATTSPATCAEPPARVRAGTGGRG